MLLNLTSKNLKSDDPYNTILHSMVPLELRPCHFDSLSLGNRGFHRKKTNESNHDTQLYSHWMILIIHHPILYRLVLMSENLCTFLLQHSKAQFGSGTGMQNECNIALLIATFDNESNWICSQKWNNWLNSIIHQIF